MTFTPHGNGHVEPVVIHPYSPAWPERFRTIAAELRHALGDVALRIDHFGSTAVPGLAAKPIIDVQVSVATLDLIVRIAGPLRHAGYIWRADNPDLTKRYFRELPGAPRTHIHVRKRGSWSEQFALLFRDYLRAHPIDAAAYAGLKQALADRYRLDRADYVDAKEPFIWRIMRAASDWSQEVGWEPGPSDG